MADAKTPEGRPWFRRAFWVTAAVLLVYIVVANVYIVRAAAPRIVATVAEAPHRPVAIVLGNTVFPDGKVSVSLYPRVLVALRLYQAHKVERIFLSGAAHLDKGYDEPGEMATWLVRHGVPHEALILDRSGFRTHATMLDAAQMGLHEVLICTEDYHLARSLYFARNAGLDAIGVVPEVSRGRFATLRAYLREGPARAEALIETALRGNEAQAGPKS